LKKNIKVNISIIVAGLIALILIALYYYYGPTHPKRPPSGTGKPPEHREGGGIFKLLGNISVFVGAFSYLWFLLKKKLKSPFKVIKWTAKKVYNLHTYAGWATLFLVVVHGGYYLIKDFKNTNNLTGTASLLLLLFLAWYGYILNKKKKPAWRAYHFTLSLMWIVAILIHGGGLVIGVGVGMAVLNIVLTWFEKRQKTGEKPKLKQAQ
jgi:hypothetical protein